MVSDVFAPIYYLAMFDLPFVFAGLGSIFSRLFGLGAVASLRRLLVLNDCCHGCGVLLLVHRLFNRLCIFLRLLLLSFALLTVMIIIIVVPVTRLHDYTATTLNNDVICC